MRCLKPGCPRTRKIFRSMYPDLGGNVCEVHSFCPWHEKSGWKEYPEYYYNKNGQRLDPETFEII